MAIAREINVELTPQEQTHFARAAAVNPEAHEAYLKGRYYLDKQNEEGIKCAIEYFPAGNRRGFEIRTGV